jgi:predicted nucleotidyltransferase
MFEKILSQIGTSLGKRGIPYMIIGGQAVLLYGEPRLTRDIDITLGVNIDRLDDILTIIQASSLKPLPKDISSFVKKTMVLPTLNEKTGIRVDFIFSFTPYEQEAINRANRVKINNQQICFVSVEDLIIHKIFAGRPRDIEDVNVIMKKNVSIDIRYIRKWLKEFDTFAESKKFLKTFENIRKAGR